MPADQFLRDIKHLPQRLYSRWVTFNGFKPRGPQFKIGGIMISPQTVNDLSSWRGPKMNSSMEWLYTIGKDEISDLITNQGFREVLIDGEFDDAKTINTGRHSYYGYNLGTLVSFDVIVYVK